MASSRCVDREAGRQCPGYHQHVPLMGGRAAGAAIYPRKWCEGVSRGLLKQKAFDKTIRTGNKDRSRAVSFLQAVSRGSNRKVQVSNFCARADGKIRPIGNWPEKWYDGVHAEDGGNDIRGVRLRNRTKILEGRDERTCEERWRGSAMGRRQTLVLTPRR